MNDAPMIVTIITMAAFVMAMGGLAGANCGTRWGREAYGTEACHKAGHESICLNGECHCTDPVK